MCGIAGILGADLTSNHIDKMSASIRHRGPDDDGTSSLRLGASCFWMGFRRLAIRDLTKAAAQPMTDESGRFTLIFNGEIYNQKELERDLRDHGVTNFKSSGDTEVLLQAWRVWGKQAPARLQGEFAFAVLDRQERRVFLCRDRLGIKPLYYSQKNEKVAFASEVKALAAVGFGDALEPRAIDGFLTFGSVPEPLTMYRGIYALPAGTIFELDLATLTSQTRRYWTNPFLQAGETSTEPDLDRLEALLRDAVQCRLVSDVPLGVFLSGGIDSGSLVSAGSKNLSRPLRTLLVDFPEQEFSERFFAQKIADRFGTSHQVILLNESAFKKELPSALAAFDQPSLDGMNSYFVCQAARQSGLTVALSGIGADELFAGYPSFRRGPLAINLQRLPTPFRRVVAAVLAHGDSVAMGKGADLLRSPLAMEDVYGALRSVFLENWRQRLLGRTTTSAGDWVRAAAPDLDSRDPINAISGLELELYLKNTLLRDMDVLSMSQSLEVRGPFLDHRLVEEMAKLSGRAKLASGTNKPLLLRTLARDLPGECVLRPKRGFAFPWQKWIQGALAPEMKKVFESGSQQWDALGIDAAAARSCYAAFREGREGIRWGHVWSLFMLQQWNVQRARRTQPALASAAGSP